MAHLPKLRGREGPFAIIVVVPLRSRIEVQPRSNDFGVKAVVFIKKPKSIYDVVERYCCKQSSSHFALAEQELSVEFRESLKSKFI